MSAWSFSVLLILFIQFQVSSYGGYLTYQAKSFGLPGDMVPLEKQPDIQFTVGTRLWAEQREAVPIIRAVLIIRVVQNISLICDLKTLTLLEYIALLPKGLPLSPPNIAVFQL